jgi:hypothetical protein
MCHPLLIAALPPTKVGEEFPRLRDVFPGCRTLYLLYQEAVIWVLDITTDRFDDRCHTQRMNGSAW